MSDPAPLESWRSICLALFPWLVHVRAAADGGLSLRSAAAKLLHLQGDAGDPPVARVGDLVVRLFYDKTAGLWVSFSTAPPYVWTAIPVSLVPPTIADAGTPVAITSGSTKVTCG